MKRDGWLSNRLQVPTASQVHTGKMFLRGNIFDALRAMDDWSGFITMQKMGSGTYTAGGIKSSKRRDAGGNAKHV